MEHQLSKQDLSNAFNGELSKLAIAKRDDAWVVVGKWCIVECLGDDQWDVFVCNPKDMAKGLGQGKVNNIVSKLKECCPQASWTMLNGEAYTQVVGVSLVLQNLKLLGIRRKRQMSEEQRKALANNLTKHRKAKAL